VSRKQAEEPLSAGLIPGTGRCLSCLQFVSRQRGLTCLLFKQHFGVLYTAFCVINAFMNKQHTLFDSFVTPFHSAGAEKFSDDDARVSKHVGAVE
jgi:hypothetical protein